MTNQVMLECPACGYTTPYLQPLPACPQCTSDWLEARYPYTQLRDEIIGTLLKFALEPSPRYSSLAKSATKALGTLKGEKRAAVEAEQLPPGARGDGACFVTLENHGQLRGCIGNMIADGPLHQAVIRNAISACQDFRFVDNPVTVKELDQLHIEISYLTPMKRVKSPDEIVIGRHGLLITLGANRGVLLPQVAYERGWTRAEFLAETCHKAGLPADAWKRPEAVIESFQAEVFGEPE